MASNNTRHPVDAVCSQSSAMDDVKFLQALKNSKTTIIFVPGAWHNALCFLGVGTKIEHAGFKVRYVTLPTCGADCHLSTMDMDVQQIRKAISEEADADRLVMVVCHSYGGVPTSVAVKDLNVKSRKNAGLPGGVFHLFYCTAFLIPEGTTLLQAAGGKNPPWIDVTPDKLVVTTRDSKDMFYHDVLDDQAEAAVAQLKPHNYQTFHTPLTYAGWRHISATYLHCTQDRALPIVAQKIMVEEFAKGVDIRTKSLHASHSPFLSMPGPTALAILDAAMTEAILMKWQDS